MMANAYSVQNIFKKREKFFFSRYAWQTVAGSICPKHEFRFSPIFGMSEGSIQMSWILMHGQLFLQPTLKTGLTGTILIAIPTLLILILQTASWVMGCV